MDFNDFIRWIETLEGERHVTRSEVSVPSQRQRKHNEP
jgi:hypothetical protein